MLESVLKYLRRLCPHKRVGIELYKVFTPTTTATINYVRREKLEEQIESSLKVPGKQIVLYGYSGSGKTTIIRKILSSQNRRYIITHCERTTTFEDIILSAFDNLDRYVLQETSTTRTHKVSVKTAASFKAIQAELEAGKEKSDVETYGRLLPPQLTSQKLAQFFGEAGIVWVIEDFHKVQEKEKTRIADVLKIFVDKANDYPDSKVVCIGACETAREVTQHDSNLKHRVDEIYVNMLSDEELRELITNGCKLLNIVMKEELVEKIVFYSARLGSSAHQMCLDICMGQGIRETQKKTVFLDDIVFQFAINGFINNNSDTLSSIYEAAVRNELGWYILKTFSTRSREKLSFNEIRKTLNQTQRSFSDEEIKNKLKELCEPEFGVIYYNANSEKYALASPFWTAFLRMQFAQEAVDKDKDWNNRRNKRLQLVDQKAQEAEVENLMLDWLAELRRR